MTHDDLVTRASRWLKNTQRCGVVLTEFHSAAFEIPDAIGWKGGPWSILVECKTNMSDFYADRKKPGRYGTRANAGLGRLRYYLTPPGLIDLDTLKTHRPKWGLLEAHPRTIRRKLKAEPFGLSTAWRELPLLYSYARRIHQYGLPLGEAQLAVCRAAELKRGAQPCN